jgi:hypothetical protein
MEAHQLCRTEMLAVVHQGGKAFARRLGAFSLPKLSEYIRVTIWTATMQVSSQARLAGLVASADSDNVLS